MDAGAICESCFTGIPVHDSLFCPVCHARLPFGKKICHRDAGYLLGGAGPYGDPTVKALILQLKFHGVRAAADPLAELILKYFGRCEFSTDGFLIIPLPLAKQRERARGFNQSAEIARRIAARMGLPCKEHILVRTKHTKPQTETATVTERRRNVESCFSVANPSGILRKKILLIDDVTTSGATFGEAVKTLKAAGARIVIAVAAAKA